MHNEPNIVDPAPDPLPVIPFEEGEGIDISTMDETDPELDDQLDREDRNSTTDSTLAQLMRDPTPEEVRNQQEIEAELDFLDLLYELGITKEEFIGLLRGDIDWGTMESAREDR